MSEKCGDRRGGRKQELEAEQGEKGEERKEGREGEEAKE